MAETGPGPPAGAAEPGVATDLPRRIVLVGPMASGKTSTGRRIARRTGYRFVDLDDAVERAAGRSIPEIFRSEGEEGFRRREAEVTRRFDDLPDGRGVVVATGGGWMAREALRERWDDAVRVWLRVSPEEALRRIGGDLESRPMLDPARPRESFRRILERRREDYGRAEYAVDTEGRTPDEVADRVLRLLRQR